MEVNYHTWDILKLTKIPYGVPRSQEKRCLLLVVPETVYSKRTPIILGTNILQEYMGDCKQEFGQQFLQKAKLYTSWYLSFRAITVREKEMKKMNNRIALVRSAEKEKIILRPNESKEIKAYTDKELNHPSTLAITHEIEDSSIPSYVDITPTLVQFEKGKRRELGVTLLNLTTMTVTISPKACLCQLQPVTIAEEIPEGVKKATQPDIVKLLTIDKNNLLTTEEKQLLKDLLTKHGDIFSSSDDDIGHCDMIKHRIDLMEGKETPFKEKHRRIPPMMIDEVRNHLEQLLSAESRNQSHHGRAK